jgi:alkanesulfonate monooxygenase SsuD/methylene tetrahydromethanopterin reductase-like flavin-dependent oxidoreductase (luciferase family)
MTTLGFVCRPEFPPERVRAIAVAADVAGLDELWLWEDCFWGGGFAAAAAVLGWTRRLRVGIGVFPVPLRNVALTAMETAMLHRLFPGRVIVGVGHGVQDWMGQVGARVESPMTLLREYLDALRALLRGERVTTQGRYVRLDDVALGWPPESAPPVLSAATGPRTLTLSGERADGTILVAGTTREQFRLARQSIEEGRARAGRTDPHPIVLNLLTVTGPGAAERLAAELRADGREPNAATVAGTVAAAVAGTVAAAVAGTVAAAVAGDAAAIAAAVQSWAAAGADTVVLQSTADDPDPIALIRLAATEIRPRLT